jgi:hypothetical protein
MFSFAAGYWDIRVIMTACGLALTNRFGLNFNWRDSMTIFTSADSC